MSTDGQDKAVREAIAGAEIGAPGLTKREYFAAMAMQGILSNPDATVHLRTVSPKTTPLVDTVAELSVEHADALLAALEAHHDK